VAQKIVKNTTYTYLLQHRKQAMEDWSRDIQNEKKSGRYKTKLKEVSRIIKCENRKFIQT